MKKIMALLIIAILSMLTGCTGGDPGGGAPPDVTKPTVTGFTIPATSASLTVVVTLTATDNVAVTGYLLTESAMAPSASATGWSATAPTSYTFGTIPNAVATPKTLYAWAKDAAGNVSTSSEATTTITLLTSAVIKLSSLGPLPAGKAVSGYTTTLELPVGVTVKTDTSGAVDPTVVVGSGLLAGSAGSLGGVSYTPATATTKAKLDFIIASTAPLGVQVGDAEYATVTLILTEVNPAVTDFNVTTFRARDLNAVVINELTSKISLSVY